MSVRLSDKGFSLDYRGSSRALSVRKQATLEEDSILGIISIDLYELDLSKVLRGDLLTLPYTISQNRIRIKNRTLIDIGANSFIFISSNVASKISRHLSIPI